ncbi:MAG: branched-chain amino acid ABC transporter permease, partial [Synergistaceae bacterium]|nr:branched-chain amino acid ABC transporter permease [Synergistaceae bacterium]
MALSMFLQHLINAVGLGSLYGLIAIGYTMVYGILRLINFAHGDIFMMSLYFAFFSITLFHMPWPLGFVAALVVTSVMGVVIEKFAYKPLRTAPKNSVLVSAIGASFLLENLAT